VGSTASAMHPQQTAHVNSSSQRYTHCLINTSPELTLLQAGTWQLAAHLALHCSCPAQQLPMGLPWMHASSMQHALKRAVGGHSWLATRPLEVVYGTHQGHAVPLTKPVLKRTEQSRPASARPTRDGEIERPTCWSCEGRWHCNDPGALQG